MILPPNISLIAQHYNIQMCEKQQPKFNKKGQIRCPLFILILQRLLML